MRCETQRCLHEASGPPVRGRSLCARHKLAPVGTTLHGDDIAAVLALLKFARSHGYAQTPAVVSLAQKMQRLAALAEGKRE